jgi:DNA-binding CsgD family transcriptional regulator
MQVTFSQNRVFDFLSAVDRTESVDAAWTLTKKFMSNYGASHVGIKLGLDTPEPLFLWSAPQWVTDMYLETVYPDNDPRLKYFSKSAAPYFHGREFWSRKDDMPAPRRHYEEEIADFSMRSLVSIPVHGRTTINQGMLAFSSGLCGKEFRKMYSERGAAMHLAGLAAVDHINRLWRKKTAKSVGITCRERECLLWLGRGLRNDQIADRLGIRRVTVEFHLANARRKLNSKTREQALVKAIQLNIIDP